MSYWLLKTEPSTYSFEELERAGTGRWDGVANNTALIHMRAVQPGDQALIYHTGTERAAVGLATVTSGPYPDPTTSDPKLVAFDLKPGERLRRPVTLAELKAEPAFADFMLLKNSRLSVMPVPPVLWKKILTLAKRAP